MTRILKVKMQNLLGETLKEEDNRLLKQRIKEIHKGTDRSVIKEIKRGGKGFLAGTTKHQRRARNKILREAGLK